MEEEEVIRKITSEHKFYVGKLKQSTASLFLSRWKKGKAKRSTVLSFMRKFGYVLDKPATYKKIEK